MKWARVTLLAGAIAAASASAAAPAPPGPGVAFLARAIDAWESGKFESASRLYQQALDSGGLAPQEVLHCYVHLGVAAAISGDTAEAIEAFRVATLLRPSFVLPPEAGKRAASLAQQARAEAQRSGALRLKLALPESAPEGGTLHLGVDVEAVELVARLRMRVSDAQSGRTFERSAPAAAHVSFDAPAVLAVAGRTVAVKVEAFDAHDNRLQEASGQVRIEPQQPYVATPPPEEEKKPPAEEEPAEEKEEAAAKEEDPWSQSHAKKYLAVRAATAPAIDGRLDDAVWKLAPSDASFLSTRSKPFGAASTEPTTVQVAYDEQNLYVAFHCSYSRPGPKDESFPGDEATLLQESESVSVLVDAVHSHTNAWLFAVSPSGARADAEISEQGQAQNLDWHGFWDVAVQRARDGWTAEFRIPWGTMRMPSHDKDFEVGVNFTRREPISGELAMWALHPPATELFDTNFFGHLGGLSQVHPGQRLFLQPYLAGAFDSPQLAYLPRLLDFAGTSPYRLYGGGYARYRPPGPAQVDVTFNPDFSAVSPDQALANFDRYEIEYPEARPFFAEDNPRFQFGAPRYAFGDLGAQLFYSRRLGIATDTAGLTQTVPILWGVKSVVRDGGTEAALMNVETTPAAGDIALADNATVGRLTRTFGGQRIGGIFLSRSGDSGHYASGGLDGSFTTYDRHLEFSGFYAASRSGGVVSAAGEGTVAWKSQDTYAKVTYLDIGSSFDAPLGYFPLTGVRGELFAAGYSPVVRNDLVQQIFLDGQLSIVRDRDSDAVIYKRGVIGLTVTTLEQAVAQVLIMPGEENVAEAFPIGNGRITVPAGDYSVLTAQFNLTSAPSRPVVFGVGYTGGDLYGGTRRAPSATLGLNLGRLTTRLTYTLYMLRYGTQDFLGHDLATSVSYAHSPLARTTLLVEADTVAARATAQLASSVQFGTLSTLTCVLRARSGSTLDTAAVNWYDSPGFSAIVSFALGMSPF